MCTPKILIAEIHCACKKHILLVSSCYLKLEVKAVIYLSEEVRKQKQNLKKKYFRDVKIQKQKA